MAKKLLYIVLCSIGSTLFGQILGTRIEKDKIQVAEPTEFRILISGVRNPKVEIPNLKSVFPHHIEIIKDSLVSANQSSGYERIFQITSYETGTFKIPEFTINVNGKALKTVGYELEVINNVSENDPMAENAMPSQVDLGLREYWEMYKFYVLGGLIGLALLFLVVFITKYYRKQQKPDVKLKNKYLRQLKELKKKNYGEENQREYYIILTEILRNYLSISKKIPADVLLTDDLINNLRAKNTFTSEVTGNISQFLLRSDEIKFAKKRTSLTTMREDFDLVKNLVETAVPEDLEDNENYRHVE